MPVDPVALDAFAAAIREGRARVGWTQEDLAKAAGISPRTIKRYESGQVGTPDLGSTRAIFLALGYDPREAAVVLGLLTREEANLPPEPRRFAAATEEVIAILEDPKVDPAIKQEWAEMLAIRIRQEGRRPRRAG